MFPRLHIGSFSVSNYWLMVVLGMVVATVTILRLAIDARLNLRRLVIMIPTAILVGMMGAHWLYVCTSWQHYQRHPLAILYFWEGRAFLGGPILGLAYVVWYARQFQLPVWKTLDVGAPALALGQFFGRLGCCAAGCCHGYPTDSCLGVCFYSRAIHPRLWRGLPLHPTQLYEAAGMLVLFYFLIWLLRRRGFDGRVCFALALLYPVLRYVVECFRGDAVRGFIYEGLSTSQFVSILVFVAALVALVFRIRQLYAPKTVNATNVPDYEQHRAPILIAASSERTI